MSQEALGIDVSQDTLDVALLTGKKPRFGRFLNTEAGFKQLIQWLHNKGMGTLHICMESTGNYSEAVAYYLYEHGYQVSVVNPALIRAYSLSMGRRFKSDKGDAELIALFCQKEEPARWTPPPACVRELKAMVHLLDDLKIQIQQQKNRLRSCGNYPTVRATWEAQIALSQANIDQLTKAVREHIKAYPELKAQKELLKSIPGIGDATAAALLCEVVDFRAFGSARKLAAYAGLVPERRDSGTSVHKKPRLVKRGNANLRKALYMPAVVAKRHNPLMRDLSARMEKTLHCKMAIIGAIMRKLLHLAYGVIKSGKPFDPDYGKAFAY